MKQFWVLSQGIWERLFKSSIPEKKEVLQSCWYWLFQRKLDYIQFEKNRCTFLWRKLSFEIARHGNFTTLLQIPSWRKVEILNSLSLQGKVILQRSQKNPLPFPQTCLSLVHLSVLKQFTFKVTFRAAWRRKKKYSFAYISILLILWGHKKIFCLSLKPNFSAFFKQNLPGCEAASICIVWGKALEIFFSKVCTGQWEFQDGNIS